MKADLLILLVISMSILGITFAAGKRIDADKEKWLDYEIRYEGGLVSLKVPPNHRFKDKPRVFDKNFESPESILNQIFSAQYDYGWSRWDNVAKFEVVYTLARLGNSSSIETSLLELRPMLNRALRAELGHASSSEKMDAEIVSIANTPWMHLFDPEKPASEAYVRRCGTQFALLVAPGYFGKDFRRDSDWFKVRRALFREMVSEIKCQ